MKSYYQHLKSTQEFGEAENLLKKPVLRSSAIFPVVHNESYSSSIHFLGYWLLKRNIQEITLVITLRNSDGKILLRKIQIINQAKAFSINLKNLLEETNLDNLKNFIGSIETEFNSTRDMVFPYPALVLEYHNDNFNTCVHTLGRIYNDIEDLKENDETLVPETGFDIHESNDLTSFLSFVNGPLENSDGYIQYTITNHDSKKLTGDFHLGKINPFETKLVYLKEHIPNLSEFLNNQSGSVSLTHNFEGFYPRFLAGNIQKSFPSVSFTHSYYDCTSCSDKTDFWNRNNDTHNDSSVYIPLFTRNNEYTNLIIYPNFSPCNFSINLEFYNKNGEKIHELPKFLHVDTTKSKLHKIDFNEIISKYENNEIYCSNITCNFENNKIPSRIKFGLDVGMRNLKSKLPCNICFNSKMGNPLIENKPGSFHWAPIFPNRNSVIAIGNFSTLKNYQRESEIEMTFFRKEDSSTISKKFTLKANCEERIYSNDADIRQFIKTEGWATIKANNPYIQGFYFNFNNSGSVSGDHLF
jgi:hypothetical protein